MHPKVEQQFKNNPITQEGVDDLLEALDIVWKRRDAQSQQEAGRIMHKIKTLKETIRSRAIAAIDPTNISIKEEILDSVAKGRQEVENLEEELIKLTQKADSDKERFLRFAFDFAENMGNQFLEISQENRLRCKQIVFPAGFRLDKNGKVYTPEVSPLITLQAKKKDAVASDNSHLVRLMRLYSNLGFEK